MNDYLDLIKRLREDEVIINGPNDHINGRTEVRKPTATELEAAEVIEEQENLIKAQDKVIEDCDARIAELEKALDDLIKAKEKWMFTQRLLSQEPLKDV